MVGGSPGYLQVGILGEPADDALAAEKEKQNHGGCLIHRRSSVRGMEVASSELVDGSLVWEVREARGVRVAVGAGTGVEFCEHSSLPGKLAGKAGQQVPLT